MLIILQGRRQGQYVGNTTRAAGRVSMLVALIGPQAGRVQGQYVDNTNGGHGQAEQKHAAVLCKSVW